MSKNLIKILFLIMGITIITLFLCVNKQTMHKQTIITDANYVFIEEVNPFIDTQIKNNQQSSEQNIKITSQNIETTNTPKVKVVSQSVTTQPTVKKVTQTKSTQNTKQNKIKTTTQPKTVTKVPVQKQTTTKPITPPQKQPQTVKQETKPTVVLTENIKPQESKVVPTPTKKVLTETEETIVWNKWRSNLQNQVMRDTKINAPMGTGFRFSFTVDKFGNMSNIKVWSTNPVYTDLAVRVIKPILTSYQRKPILVFPEGTKRTITNVTGGFSIATKTEYSKPSDYSDYEKIKKTQYN